jgi:hypothetical protein
MAFANGQEFLSARLKLPSNGKLIQVVNPKVYAIGFHGRDRNGELGRYLARVLSLGYNVRQPLPMTNAKRCCGSPGVYLS